MIRLVNDKKFVIQTIDERRLEREVLDLQLMNSRIEVNEANKLIERLNREVEYYRRRYDEALERSDRQLDGILAQSGLPEVTATTKRENSEREEKAKTIIDEHERELKEMFSESLNEMEEYDSLVLPDELKVEAAKLIASKV
jgi:hypothetical protein